MKKVEFHIPFKVQQILTVFRISGLTGLQHFHWILSRMTVWDWHLIKCTKPFLYCDVGGVDC
jgi:hypothetical protein